MPTIDSIDDLRAQLTAAVAERDELRAALSVTAEAIARDPALDDGRASWWFSAYKEGNRQRAELRLALSRANNPEIPPAILRSLTDYADHGLRPGQCVSAILTGDLFHAFAMADPETARAMPEIVTHVVSRMRAPYGNRPTVDAWIDRGGRNGGGR